jgi:hypothetical protein
MDELYINAKDRISNIVHRLFGDKISVDLLGSEWVDYSIILDGTISLCAQIGSTHCWNVRTDEFENTFNSLNDAIEYVCKLLVENILDSIFEDEYYAELSDEYGAQPHSWKP